MSEAAAHIPLPTEGSPVDHSPQERVFNYQPLDLDRSELRLLSLLPPLTGDANEPIRCSLEHISLLSHTAEYVEWAKGLPIETPPQTKLQQWKIHKTPPTSSNEEEKLPVFSPSCFRYTWGDYIAISYMWGTASLTHKIILNGFPFPVTENLDAALKNVQSVFTQKEAGEEASSAPKIWVDAICINQEDMEERAREVKRMREIYSKAFSVIVSLGNGVELEKVEEVFTFIRTLAPAISKGIKYSTFKQQQAGASHGLLPQLFAAIWSMGYHPYWRRLWVIQEIALAADPIIVTCDRSSVYLHDFRMVWLFISLEAQNIIADGVPEAVFSKHADINASGILSRFDALKTVSRQTLHHDASKNSLTMALSVLSLGMTAKATNPLDHIYGMLGLMPPLLSDKVEVNYDSKPAEVFASFTRMIIEQTQNLDTIFYVNQKQDTRPTWAADWTRGFDRYYTFHERGSIANHGVETYSRWRDFLAGGAAAGSGSKSEVPARADAYKRAPISFSQDGKFLHCKGIKLGSIDGFSAEGTPVTGKAPTSLSPSRVVQPSTTCNPYGDDEKSITQALIATISMAPSSTARDSPLSEVIFKVPWCPHSPDFNVEKFLREADLPLICLAAEMSIEPSWKKVLGIDNLCQLEILRRTLASFFICGKPLKEYFPKEGSGFEPLEGGGEREVSKVEMATLNANIVGRRVAVLKNGYFALVPAVAGEADEVWVLFGASMPVVLRDCGEGGALEVVGEGFVEGFMGGEVMAAVERGEYKVEDVILC